MTELAGQYYSHHLQQFSAEDGLSNANITAIWTDRRGIIWLGTQYGLNRFDGHRFKNYTAEKDGLCDNTIRKITEDEEGNLWILGGESTNGVERLCVLNPGTDEIIPFETYIKNDIPFALEHTLLFDSRMNYLLFREEKEEKYRFYTVKEGRIQLLFDLSKKDYTFGTSDHIMQRADGSFVTTVQPNAGKNQTGGFVFFDSNGILVKKETTAQNVTPKLHTDGRYLYLETSENVGNNVAIIRILRDSQLLGENDVYTQRAMYAYGGDHFIYIRQDGIFLYQSRFQKLQILKYFYDPKTLPSGEVLLADRGGGFWYTKGESLLRLNIQARHFHTIFDDALQKRDNAIRGIHTTPDNQYLYASSTDHLHRVRCIDGKQDKIALSTDSVQFTNLNNVFLKDSILWIATEQQGLVQYNLSTKQFTHFDNLQNNAEKVSLRQFFQADDGRLWVGSSRGLLHIDTTQDQLISFQGYNADFPDLAISKINAFYHNVQGTWLSTSSGLYLLDLSQERILAHYNSARPAPYAIPAENITHLHEDTSGVFWLATIAQGLVRWNPKTNESQSFTKASCGLPNNILYAVYEDDFNQLWLPSNQGLICFDKTTFQNKAYYKSDGLPYTEFSALAHHKANDGRLYFGSQNGLVLFYPESFNTTPAKDSLQVIEVVKTKIQGGQMVNISNAFFSQNTIELSPSDKFITIQLAIPNYNHPKGKQYSYRVLGHHEDWHYQDAPEITISGFPYGKYQLQFRGKVAGSKEWLNYPNTIALYVAKPVYLQWWFILLVLASLAGLIYLFVRRNTQKLRKRQEELETIVEERTAQIKKDKALIEEQAEELRTLDKVKSNFFANVAHELRTPLTLILGPLSYILDNPEAWEKEEVQQQLLVMQRNGKSLLQLVEEILDLSKLEAHKLELEEEPTSVVSFFEHIFTVFEPQFQSQNLDYELTFNLYEDDVFVLMDRKKMKKVIHNFLSNALKYTPRRGKIKLDVRELEDTLCIQVSDTGKGVHPKDLPYIFERFYQSKQVDQKREGGTGIGLALVSEFADLMRGRAWAESELGVGSRFYFEWPKQKTKAFQITTTGESVTDSELDKITSIGTDFTILVVEDNPDMRQFVCGLLEKHYTVLSAVNGLEGLEQLRNTSNAIHLVVSDIMMPEMDGLEMLTEIKSDSRLSGIPVIMLTALAGERDKLHALTIGVDDYLTKPFSVPELLTRVQNLLYNYHQRQQWQLTKAAEQENGKRKKKRKTDDENMGTLSISDKEWIANARKMVEASFSESLITIDELAQHQHLSVRQLNRKLNSITGLSAGRFIREVQLESARQILEDGMAVSVSEVGYRCGFAYPSTFSNLFKKRYGKSPGEFLKEKAGKL